MVRQGIRAANEVADEAAPDSVWGAWLTAGLAGVSAKLTKSESREALETWLEAFGGQVRAGGPSGGLRATKVIRLPAWAAVRVAVACSCRGGGRPVIVMRRQV